MKINELSGKYQNGNGEVVEININDQGSLSLKYDDGSIDKINIYDGHINGWYVVFYDSNDRTELRRFIKFSDKELFLSREGIDVPGDNHTEYFNNQAEAYKEID